LYLKNENSPSRINNNFNDHHNLFRNENSTPINNSNSNSNGITIFNKTSINKTPTNLNKPQQKFLFSQNKEVKDNNPIRVKRIDNNKNIPNSNIFTEVNNTTNFTMNNPNIISFNNFSENVFFTTDVYNKQNKDITNYEFDDKFVD